MANSTQEPDESAIYPLFRQYETSTIIIICGGYQWPAHHWVLHRHCPELLSLMGTVATTQAPDSNPRMDVSAYTDARTFHRVISWVYYHPYSDDENQNMGAMPIGVSPPVSFTFPPRPVSPRAPRSTAEPVNYTTNDAFEVTSSTCSSPELPRRNLPPAPSSPVLTSAHSLAMTRLAETLQTLRLEEFDDPSVQAAWAQSRVYEAGLAFKTLELCHYALTEFKNRLVIAVKRPEFSELARIIFARANFPKEDGPCREIAVASAKRIVFLTRNHSNFLELLKHEASLGFNVIQEIIVNIPELIRENYNVPIQVRDYAVFLNGGLPDSGSYWKDRWTERGLDLLNVRQSFQSLDAAYEGLEVDFASLHDELVSTQYYLAYTLARVDELEVELSSMRDDKPLPGPSIQKEGRGMLTLEDSTMEGKLALDDAKKALNAKDTQMIAVQKGIERSKSLQVEQITFLEKSLQNEELQVKSRKELYDRVDKYQAEIDEYHQLCDELQEDNNKLLRLISSLGATSKRPHPTGLSEHPVIGKSSDVGRRSSLSEEADHQCVKRSPACMALIPCRFCLEKGMYPAVLDEGAVQESVDATGTSESEQSQMELDGPQSTEVAIDPVIGKVPTLEVQALLSPSSLVQEAAQSSSPSTPDISQAPAQASSPLSPPFQDFSPHLSSVNSNKTQTPASSPEPMRNFLDQPKGAGPLSFVEKARLQQEQTIQRRLAAGVIGERQAREEREALLTKASSEAINATPTSTTTPVHATPSSGLTATTKLFNALSIAGSHSDAVIPQSTRAATNGTVPLRAPPHQANREVQPKSAQAITATGPTSPTASSPAPVQQVRITSSTVSRVPRPTTAASQAPLLGPPTAARLPATTPAVIASTPVHAPVTPASTPDRAVVPPSNNNRPHAAAQTPMVIVTAAQPNGVAVICGPHHDPAQLGSSMAALRQERDHFERQCQFLEGQLRDARMGDTSSRGGARGEARGDHTSRSNSHAFAGPSTLARGGLSSSLQNSTSSRGRMSSGQFGGTNHTPRGNHPATDGSVSHGSAERVRRNYNRILSDCTLEYKSCNNCHVPFNVQFRGAPEDPSLQHVALRCRGCDGENMRWDV